jgi:hypothetical protein
MYNMFYNGVARMTLLEKRAWLGLCPAFLILAYIIANTTEGFAVVDQSTRHLWRTWLVALFLGVVGDSLIGRYHAQQRKKGNLIDERDGLIEIRAERIGFYGLVVGLNILLWQLLMEETFKGHPGPVIDLTHAPTLFLAIFATIWVGYIAKSVAIIVLSRQ